MGLFEAQQDRAVKANQGLFGKSLFEGAENSLLTMASLRPKAQEALMTLSGGSCQNERWVGQGHRRKRQGGS